MAILHGSWILPPSQAEPQNTKGFSDDRAASSPGYLFIWGEVWRRIEPEMLHTGLALLEAPVQRHPFAMTPVELLASLRSRHEAGQLRLPPTLLEPAEAPAAGAKARRSRASKETAPSTTELPGRWQTHPLSIPSYLTTGELELPVGTIVPHHSAVVEEPATESTETPERFLYPWSVEGVCLDPIAAFTFLNSLPLGTIQAEDSFLSGDLRFWSHTARWSLDLLARSKFLPGLEKAEGLALARWQPLLDSAVDQVRWKHFVDRMPVACRLYPQRKAEEQGEQGKPEATGDHSDKDRASNPQPPTPNPPTPPPPPAARHTPKSSPSLS